MSNAGGVEELEARIERVARCLADTIVATGRRDDGVDERLNALERKLRLTASSPSPRVPVASAVRAYPENPTTPPRRARDAGLVPGHFAPVSDDASARDGLGMTGGALSDLVGGRVLAWLGAVATLLGIVLFLGLAISRGWIDEPTRVIIAAFGSAGLMLVGMWLHDRRGRTEAAIALVGTATAASFATLIVAAEVHELIPPIVAVAGSLAVGILVTRLAIQWAGRAIGAIGLVGALLSPVLVGADLDGGTIATLAVAAACAMAVVTRQGWRWLGLVTVAACAPQWATWVLRGEPIGFDLIVLATFTVIGLAGAIGAELRDSGELPRASMTAAVALNACVAATVGYFALRDAAGTDAGAAWLAGLAAVHAGIGLWRGVRLSHATRQLLVVLGVVLADVAFGLSASGIVLVAGWAASALGFAWLGRAAARDDRGDATLLGLGMGAHLGLVLMRALIEAPPSQLGAGDTALLPLLSVSVLIASSLGCAEVTDRRLVGLRSALHAVGLFALAYLTAAVVDGPALVATWAFEALTLHRLARRSDEPAPRCAALLFFAGAVAYALIAEAPPSALVVGARDLGAAAVALGAIAVVALGSGRQEPNKITRRWLLAGGAAAVIYLASVAIVTAFQPAVGVANDSVLDLGVRQQGQVLLSALWSAVGFSTLVFALRRRMPALRTGALALLLISVAKVFLYDLSTLTSIYRVVSFVVLGLLLLAAAFAYQRLRPPPVPDMRSVHPSQR
jgi:uncharacterized membrane protein